MLNVINKRSKLMCSFQFPQSWTIVCLSWIVSVCVVPTEQSRNFVKESGSLDAKHRTCTLNTLRTVYSIFEVQTCLCQPPFCAALSGSTCYCCRLFAGKRDQKQATAINPHHWGSQQLMEQLFLVICKLFSWSFINWMWAEWFYLQFW